MLIPSWSLKTGSIAYREFSLSYSNIMHGVLHLNSLKRNGSGPNLVVVGGQKDSIKIVYQ